MIQRNTTATEPTFSVGLNVILSGSKKMTLAEQDAAVTVAKVRVLIVDAGDPNNILVDEIISAQEFKTGSVGYGLHTRGLTFKKGGE